MPNRLANERSLYLRQHAGNPVDWYPWGAEALKKAQAEDKPLLISIGYSACHWCHVMAHESFEDEYIARLMNAHFVCIKIDREERPDLDAIYMDSVQMLYGHGGWPLNVFCLPDGRPFAGGTYFPPDDRRGHGQVPWPQLLMRVADFYQRQRADLEENAHAIVSNLQASNLPTRGDGESVGPATFFAVTEQLIEAGDPQYGGFGGAPKFPPCPTLDFMLAMRNAAAVDLGQRELAQQLDGAINRTLTAMAHGGLFDQIGGGFARYCVDAIWLIPHFEKMLYDNAQLIEIYSKAYQRYPKAIYARVVAETIDWLQREMHAGGPAFAAALDADTNGEEGLTYLWTPAEVREILGAEQGQRFCDVYGISEEGNFERSGRSHAALLEGDIAVRDELASSRERLLQARLDRPQPGRDDKRLTAWNALLLRGLATAAFTFGRKDWMDQALALAEWLWNDMRRDNDRLYSLAYDGERRLNAHLDDYAYTIEAFLALSAVIDWHAPCQAGIWQERAVIFAQALRHHFRDPFSGGFYFTSDDHEDLIHRRKDWTDNSTPSANACLVHSFAALELLTGSPEYGSEIERLGVVYPALAGQSPLAVNYALSGFVQRASGIAVLKCAPSADIEAIRKGLVSRPWRRVFIQTDPELVSGFLLCIGTQCLAPTDDVAEVCDAIG